MGKSIFVQIRTRFERNFWSEIVRTMIDELKMFIWKNWKKRFFSRRESFFSGNFDAKNRRSFFKRFRDRKKRETDFIVRRENVRQSAKRKFSLFFCTKIFEPLIFGSKRRVENFEHRRDVIDHAGRLAEVNLSEDKSLFSFPVRWKKKRIFVFTLNKYGWMSVYVVSKTRSSSERCKGFGT